MRLIDADRLMDSLRGNVLIDVTSVLEETIAHQPTVSAYGENKVIELQKISWTAGYKRGRADGYREGYDLGITQPV